MKAILFFFLEVMLCAGSFANKTWSYCYSGITSTYENSVVIGDSMIVMSIKSGNECYYTRHLIALNRNGKVLWSVFGGGQAITYDSTGIYVAGTAQLMSDVPQTAYYTLDKFDFSGDSIFHSSFPINPMIGSDTIISSVPNRLSILQNGHILMSTADNVIIYDSTGKIQSVFNYDSLKPLLGAQWYSSGFILVNEDGVYLMNYSGTEVARTTPFYPIQNFLLQQDSLFLVCKGKIFLYPDIYSTPDTLYFNGNLNYQSIKINDHRIMALETKDPVNTLDQISWDTSSNADTAIPITLQSDSVFNDFQLIGGQLILFTTSVSNQAAAYAYYPGQNETLFFPDIACKDMLMKETGLAYWEGYPESGYYFNADFIVENKGKDTIRSYVIYVRFNGELNCSFNEHLWTVQDQRLAPGEYDTIHEENLSQDGMDGHLCFKVMVPNQQVDANFSDNYLCKDFVLSDLRETGTETGFSVYPNPMTDVMYIKDTRFHSNTMFNIMDIQGRILKQGVITAKSTKIDMKGLQPGIYILQIKNAAGLWNKKFIKEGL